MPYKVSNGFGRMAATDEIPDSTILKQKARDAIALKAAQAGGVIPKTMTANQAKIMAEIERLRKQHEREREAWRKKSDAYRAKVGALLDKLGVKAPAKTMPVTRKSRRTR